MPGDEHRFETGVKGQLSEELCIALADGEAGVERGGGGASLNVVCEEGVDVVADVVVEPGEDCAGFVS